jgi:hypothetical protein
MSTNEAAASYERPTVTVVGSLREKTESASQVNKYFSETSDFHYPQGFKFNYS